VEVKLNVFLMLALDGSGQLHVLRTLSLPKAPQYVLGSRLGGPHRQHGSCWEKKNLYSISNSDSSLSRG